MQAVRSDWKPRNRITTPLTGTPSYVNSGIIKAVMKNGEKISVFQGLPGIDMELRLDYYYRVNYIPVFITERTPSENREDLWEILERRRESPIVEKFSPERLPALQYGDKVIVDSLEQIGDTTAGFADNIFTAVTNGVDIVSQDGDVLVGMIARSAMVSVAVTQRILERREYASKRRAGIEQAKKNGKYTGRKPVEVDEKVLRQVNQELKAGLITVEEAMKRTKIGSRSTFYRKVRVLERHT